MKIVYRVIGTSTGVDTTEQDFIYDDKEWPHSSHLVDIMRKLDCMGIDLRSITVVPYYLNAVDDIWYIYESATGERAERKGRQIQGFTDRDDAKAVMDSLIEWSLRNA